MTSTEAKARELLKSFEGEGVIPSQGGSVLAAEVGALYDSLRDFLLRPVRVAPTLMKYAEPNAYEIETRRELRAAATELLAPIAIGDAPTVDLLDDDPLEIELAATLLVSTFAPFVSPDSRSRQRTLPESRRNEIIDLGLRHRGRHDEVLRPFCAGQQFRFDILMDIGGFRDMHRHRRCVQIVQDYTTAHGHDMPVEIESAGLADRYQSALERARQTATRLASRSVSEALVGQPATETEAQSQYVIPLAFRKRTLFKMDFAEALYISELRTGAAGHFSYRNVAFAMYEAVAQRYPALAKYFRVTDVREPVDLLKR